MAKKSKPIFTLNVDSRTGSFTLRYDSTDLKVRAIGSTKKMTPHLRALALPLFAALNAPPTARHFDTDDRSVAHTEACSTKQAKKTKRRAPK